MTNMREHILFLILSFLAPPLAGLDLPAYLWSCQGEVHYAEAPDQPENPLEECIEEMMFPLPAGSRIRVIDGRAWLTNGEKDVTLDADDPLYHVKDKVVGKEDPWIRELLSYLVFRKKNTLLKGDEEQQFAKFPYLEVTTADGPLLKAWQGSVLWHHVPPDRPLALRVSSDDRLVWGPKVLIEPIFDLGELADLEIDQARLELMLVDSPYLPSEGTLRFPLGRLLALQGTPVPTVVLAELRLASPEERATLDRPFDGADAGWPALLAAARAVEENRLGTARGILRAEYGSDLPLSWQRAVSQLEILGDFSAPKQPEPACASDADADALWSCFWNFLGPAVVPELLPGDLPAAVRLAERLMVLEPEGWRALVAAAQIDLLYTRHAEARRKLTSAVTRCRGSEHCTSTVALLENLVIVDSHSSFSRGLSDKSHISVEPEYLLNLQRRNARLGPAWDSVDPTAERAGHLWRIAADIRSYRGALESLRYHLSPQQFTEIARKFRDGIPKFGSDDPAIELLSWSMYPEGKHPHLPRELRPAARWFQAEAVIAPNGSFGAFDVVPPLDASVFHQEGLFSPSIIEVDATGFEQEYELLAFHRSSPSPVSVARRLMLVAAAKASLGEPQAAHKLLDQAELFLRGKIPSQDLAGLKLIRSRLAVSSDTEECLGYLRASIEIAKESGSPGRIHSILQTWAELIQQIFHHQNRYRDGLALLDEAVQAAIESGFLHSAMELNVTGLKMLNDLRLYPQTLRRSDQTRRIAIRVKERLDERNIEIIARIEGKELPELAKELTSMNSFHANMTGIGAAEISALANLGALWSKIENRIEMLQKNFQEMTDGSLPESGMVAFAGESLKSGWMIQVATARADFDAAERMAKTTDNKFLAGLWGLTRGELDVLHQKERELAGYQKLLAGFGAIPLPSDPSSAKQVGMLGLVRKTLLQERELYLMLSATVGAEGQTRKQLEAWDVDELTGKIGVRRPWRRQHLEAQVLEAEGNHPKALEIYDRLVRELHEQFFAGQFRNLHRKFVQAQEDAYLGSARVSWDLYGDGAARKALDRIDELRWLAGERTLFATRSDGPVPLPDLERVARGLGKGGRLVIVGSFGRYRETVAWVYSEETGLQAQRFLGSPEELLFKEALKLSMGQQVPASAMVEEIAGWLASKIPSGAPVALIVNGELRKLGIHLLSIDGMPWPLRNPMTLAPSLRTLSAAQQREMTGRGKVVVGLPLTEDGSAGDYQPIEDHDRLENLAAGGSFLWSDKATVDEVGATLSRAARVHLSTHGTVDIIDPSKTGVKLYKGEMLNLDRASRIELPGSLVILSACQSGDWGNLSANTVSTLDRIFLARGASTVVSTTEQVRPEVAAVWMGRFHEVLDSGETPIQAARAAYKATRDRFTDPWEWGAFVVVGSGVGSF